VLAPADAGSSVEGADGGPGATVGELLLQALARIAAPASRLQIVLGVLIVSSCRSQGLPARADITVCVRPIARPDLAVTPDRVGTPHARDLATLTGEALICKHFLRAHWAEAARTAHADLTISAPGHDHTQRDPSFRRASGTSRG
jgi:hypothetical protein